MMGCMSSNSAEAAINQTVVEQVVNLVPAEWLNENSRFPTTTEHRQAYIDYLTTRLEAPRNFVEEAIRAL